MESAEEMEAGARQAMTQEAFHFDGATYEPEIDQKRLNTQLGRVYLLMKDGHWRTLRQIADVAHGSENGVNARLRDFRKERFQKVFGVWDVQRNRISKGLYEYRMLRENAK